jgi:hypothetical protein
MMECASLLLASGINVTDDDDNVPLLAVNHVLHHRLGEREIRERRDIDRYLHPKPL